jgi:hypothetical protein
LGRTPQDESHRVLLNLLAGIAQHYLVEDGEVVCSQPRNTPMNSRRRARTAAHSASVSLRFARSSKASRATASSRRGRPSRSALGYIVVGKKKRIFVLLKSSSCWLASVEPAGEFVTLSRLLTVRAISTTGQPLMHPAHVDAAPASDRNGRNLAGANQLGTESVGKAGCLRKLRNGDQLGHRVPAPGRCSWRRG